ncbi:MAG: polysaccharide deacetylase family protein [Acidobacteriota bacterium]|nr:polysaccharide deacetylase family protein [Acidobacteriota bacterium]
MPSLAADIVSSTLVALGAEAWVSKSSWRTQRLLVLCWHGLSNEDEHVWRPGLYISPQLFRRRLEILAELGCSVLSLDDALKRLWAGDLPPRSVVITFDDGFNDFATKAVPMLREFGFPATVYLTTYHVDDPHPLFNLIVSYALWKSSGRGRRLPNGTPIGNRKEAELAAQSVVRQAAAEGLSPAEKNARARELTGSLGLDYDELCGRRMLCLMTADQVRDAAKSNVAVEAHTHRHRTPDDLDLMVRELRDNISCIQQITGRRPAHFCYPSGVFNERYFPLLEQEGFLSAATCEHGLATRRGHPYMIPRWLDKQKQTENSYRWWLSGLRPFIERPALSTMRNLTFFQSPKMLANISRNRLQKDYRG